ncbi:MAG: hypothetical protein HDS29_00390 [Bacteroides sp.]|nr:hypothetical protein [Bacteroides sp.]MBD5284722.1 hypothetical protein [Bacteroides sp.]
MKNEDRQISLNSLEAMLVAIELYFDCRLSDEEERRLRRAIAVTRVSHPAIDEARAVMGLRKPAERVIVSRKVLRQISIAASVALLIAGGIGISRYFSESSLENKSIAYVNGVKVTDEDEVMRLFNANLSIMSDGIEEMDSRFDKMVGAE